MSVTIGLWERAVSLEHMTSVRDLQLALEQKEREVRQKDLRIDSLEMEIRAKNMFIKQLQAELEKFRMAMKPLAHRLVTKEVPFPVSVNGEWDYVKNSAPEFRSKRLAISAEPTAERLPSVCLNKIPKSAK
ncbi:uncharacterized protein LOC111641991 [Centruroides sculpturatus]|nr:uncharacterized protein LOC111641991 [Centruroides sculpturatus]